MTAPRTIAPLLAVRAAVVAATTAAVPGLTWHTTLAPAGTVSPYAVWSASAERDPTYAVFGRRALDQGDEFGLYADATDTRTATEVAYAVYAAMKNVVDGRTLALGNDALGTGLLAASVALRMIALLDDPDVPNRVHLHAGLTVTAWSA